MIILLLSIFYSIFAMFIIVTLLHKKKLTLSMIIQVRKQCAFNKLIRCVPTQNDPIKYFKLHSNQPYLAFRRITMRNYNDKMQSRGINTLRKVYLSAPHVVDLQMDRRKIEEHR